MTTHVRFFGQLRSAERVGTLDGRDVYFLAPDFSANGTGRAIVSQAGKTEHVSVVFLGPQTIDLDPILRVQWSDGEAAANAQAWVAEKCTALLNKLNAVVESLRQQTTETQP